MPEKLLTTAEVAAELRVSTKTVLRMVRSGQLQGMKVGRSWRILGSALPSSTDRERTDVVYLDDNGSNPLRPEVLEAMNEVWAGLVGNASSSHVIGQRSRARIEDAREQLAALVSARPADVIFTSGATEANNLILRGLPLTHRRLVVSAGEHDSVARVAESLSSGGVRTSVITLTSGGSVDLDALDEALAAGDVGLVSIVAANGETGVLNPIGEIAHRAHAVGALLHCDATQWVGRLPWSMVEQGPDAISLSGHKMGGPQGVGALIAQRSLLRQLQPAQVGGGHERGLRSGSYNVAGIVGIGVAASLAAAPSDAQKTRALRDRLVRRLSGIGGVVVNGAAAERLPNTANVQFAGAAGAAVLSRSPGVAASLGSACHAGALEPSPTLLAMGLSRDAAEESIRFSVTRVTTRGEIDSAASEILRAVHEVRTVQQVA